MQQIDSTAVHRWKGLGSNHANAQAPLSVSTVCPICGAVVVFSLDNHTYDSHRLAVAAHGSCPKCRQRVKFWALWKKASSRSDMGKPEDIYMYPPASNHYPAPPLDDAVPEPLRRSFASMIDSFNAGIYPAAAVTGRRTLEGIFKYLLPEEKRKQNLHKLIESTKDHVNLAEPLTALSHAVRSGGNLGAHFDMEREPDEAVARKMVELLEYLISYLYVLPKKIQALEAALNGTDAQPLTVAS